ncbi:MAG: FAD:protein FMN transferase [Deltaproteobacteria bacterium]|uniref:FAD:protein FMN transferase n=1 Tax=Candidatus Zymogenus saltonus TaxID=2844893 RepID=A0A9D8PRY2_9DELT|nr:FAD:protein FMN transferase [Candidatus Zymogenus saltonus]
MKLKSILKYILPFIVVAVLFSVWYFKRRTVTVTDTRLMLGTVVEITVMGEAGERRDILYEAVESAFLKIAEIETIADRHTAKSEISKLNRMAKEGELGPIPVSDEIIEMLDLSRIVSERSDGAFDITVAPIIDLWDFSSDGKGRVPDEDEIRKRLKLVDYRNVAVEKGTKEVSFRKTGTRLDLGGIAKGYAVDEAAEVLRKLGIKSGVVNAGGDIAVIGYKGGGKKGGDPWRIGIQDPRNPKGLIAVLRLNDASVVTSGDYERYFIENGKRYHHIIDPKTGYPSDSSISVTVVAKNTALADALATAIFVLGPERGLRLVKDFAEKTGDGENSVEALIVGPKGKLFKTEGLSKIMEYLD